MSPPEVWGPHIWRLFHTLVERLNEDDYPFVYKSLVSQIQRICRFLPCPDCASHATKYLTKVNLANSKTKTELKNALYLFHNYVNARKRKPLFNYANIDTYKNYKLSSVINNFLMHYNTKGNMKLLTESFQRQFVIKDFKKWLTLNIKAFSPKIETFSPKIETFSPKIDA
jgi:hypothetical protein